MNKKINKEIIEEEYLKGLEYYNKLLKDAKEYKINEKQKMD